MDRGCETTQTIKEELLDGVAEESRSEEHTTKAFADSQNEVQIKDEPCEHVPMGSSPVHGVMAVITERVYNRELLLDSELAEEGHVELELSSPVQDCDKDTQFEKQAKARSAELQVETSEDGDLTTALQPIATSAPPVRAKTRKKSSSNEGGCNPVPCNSRSDGSAGNVSLKSADEENHIARHDVSLWGNEVDEKPTWKMEGGVFAMSWLPGQLPDINPNKRYICDVCNYACRAPSYLRIHMRVHTGERPFSCDICDFTAIKATHLKRHMKNHSGEKPFACDMCDFTSAHSYVMIRHKITHSDDKAFACNLCNYTCKRNSDVKRHMMSHMGEKPYSCDFCDYKCSHSHYLKRHVRMHTGERPYKCDVCDYSCRQAIHLRIHKRSHTGEKPYVCHLCEYATGLPGNLKKHLMTHTQDRPYVCDVCGFSVKAAYDLKKHRVIHSSEKPYACQVCDFSCRARVTLKKHEKIHFSKS